LKYYKKDNGHVIGGIYMFGKKEKCADKPKKSKQVRLFHLFFNKFTYYGVVLILGSIIISLILKENTWKYGWLLEILASLFNTLGIALFLGAFFDLAKNSDEFVNIISNVLTNIVVSKAFLNTLGEKDKRQAMEIILKPTGDQLQQYSNINGYFQKKVDESIQILDTNFKSNLTAYVDVYKDKNLNKVVAKTMLRYRIYKINNKFEKIQTWFEHEKSEFLSIKIFHNTQCLVIDKDKISDLVNGESENENNQASAFKKTFVEVPEELNDCPYLTVEYNILEYGFDHWINFHWTSLTPYDGIDFQLRCTDELTIKETYIFDDTDGLRCILDDEQKNILIISTRWQNSFTGFMITVGEDTSKIEKEDNPSSSSVSK
jgi:hypothetical protein